MRQKVPETPKIASDERGSIMMEAGFVTVFLSIAFIGLIDIAFFISSKEQTERAANQVATVYAGSQGVFNEGFSPLLVGLTLTPGAGGAINVMECMADGTQRANIGVWYKNANCMGVSGSGTWATFSFCTAAGPAYANIPFIQVTAACAYDPIFSSGIFPEGIRVQSVARAMMYGL